MKHIFGLLLIWFGLLQSVESCGKNPARNADESPKPTPLKTMEKKKFDRLPDNVQPETAVEKASVNDRGETVSVETTTVEKILNELKAVYKNDRLVDGNGREIKFYEPLCRGVSRGFEGDREDQKEKENELSELKKNYTVVVLYCDPRKAL